MAVMLPNTDPFQFLITCYHQRDLTLCFFKEIFALQSENLFTNFDRNLHFPSHLLQERDHQLQCYHFGVSLMVSQIFKIISADTFFTWKFETKLRGDIHHDEHFLCNPITLVIICQKNLQLIEHIAKK